MPSRSPQHRSTPPPPLISRFSPGRSRGRSPVASSSRDRARRRESRPTVRRMRSPVHPKRHSYSPPIKRKASPVPERAMSRRRKISKSPVRSRSRSRGGSEHRYNTPALQPDPRLARNVSGSGRFGDKEYVEHREGGVPHFRGPEGSVDFNINDLKNFTIEMVRKPSNSHTDSVIKRDIINADEIGPVRRPDEGLTPLFQRVQASTSGDGIRSDEYKRIITVDNSRRSGGRDRDHSRERSPVTRPRTYSPAPGPSHYEDHRRPYYPNRERARSPHERHRSPYKDEYVERRDKHRERQGGSGEYLRRDLDGRKREERRYSPERRPSYERDHRERGSDLRSRINEKRSDLNLHSRIEERHHESDMERHGRTHHFSPPHERRRLASPKGHEGLRNQREAWERDRVREGRDSASMHQARYTPPEYSGDYDESRRPPSSHKNDYEPKKFYKSFEAKEFIPPPIRGRGMPTRRSAPSNFRGRGLGRGVQRGFRGGTMAPRGMSHGGTWAPRGMSRGGTMAPRGMSRGGTMAPRGMSRGAPFEEPRGFAPRKSSY